ncbi:SDR family NAD(P)-dependent oxidoreductase [Streptomyces sp. NPDC059455]|uniref:SDR family NAD(P)-dependent oxidoreductase n=1 Tax=Streptomyces sp. NPDC059455 TaxID=3346837 RepID=UPI003686A308
MNGRMEGMRVLVVGGGAGIGKGAALAYLDQGAVVTVVERSEHHAAALRRETEGSPLEVVVGDATSPAVLYQALSQAIDTTGGLDHLTCCVGVFDHYASLRELSVEELVKAAEEIWRVNVLATLVAVRIAWPALHEAGGSVTLTLSESAFHPVGGGVLYGSSKWALRGVVQHLAADLGPSVRVNGVAPGGTSGTGFSGLAALGESESSVAAVSGRDERIAAGTMLGVTPSPADHAGAYVYLADPEASRVVTGLVINSDGGRALR